MEELKSQTIRKILAMGYNLDTPVYLPDQVRHFILERLPQLVNLARFERGDNGYPKTKSDEFEGEL